MLWKQSFRVGQLEQLAQHAFARLRGARRTDDSKVITAISDLDIEPSLDMTQMLIELTAEIGEPGVIFRLQNQIPADR